MTMIKNMFSAFFKLLFILLKVPAFILKKIVSLIKNGVKNVLIFAVCIGTIAYASGYFEPTYYQTEESFIKMISGHSEAENMGEINSAVSSKLADREASEDVFQTYLAQKILSVILLFLVFKLIILKKASSVDQVNQEIANEVSQTTKLIVYLLFAGFLTTPIYETKTPSGYVYKKSIITMFIEEAAVRVFHKTGEITTKDYGQKVEVPDITVSPAGALIPLNREILSLFLRSNFDDIGEKELGVYKNKNEYLIHFKMGGKKVRFSTTEQINLNERAFHLGFNLKEKEKETFVSLSKAVFESAEKARYAISFANLNGIAKDSKFGVNVGDDSQERFYTKKYDTYCSSIYEPLTDRDMNEFAINEYIDVVAYCASKNQVSSLYANSFYDYEKVISHDNELAGNRVAIFSNSNLGMNVDDIIDNTNTICNQGGYMACSNAVVFASYEDRVRNLRFDAFTPIIRMFAPLAFSIKDAEGLLTSRRFETERVLSKDFAEIDSTLGNYELIGKIQFSIDNKYGFDYQLNGNPYDLESFNFESITQEEVARTVLGKDLSVVWGRINTCLEYSSQIKNGYRCMKPTTELTNLMLGLGQMSMRAFLFSYLTEPKHSTQTDGFEMGKKIMVNVKLIAGSAMTYATDTPFIETPYYAADSQNNLFVARIITNFATSNDTMGVLISDLFNGIARILLLITISLLVFIFTMPFMYIKNYTLAIIEFLIFKTIAPMVTIVSSANGNPSRIIEVVVGKAMILLIYAGVMVTAIKMMNTIILLVIDIVVGNRVLEWNGYEGWLMSWPYIAVSTLVAAYSLHRIQSFEISILNTLMNILERVRWSR
ncbi:hypothetical protein K7J31_002873 [Vibrio parahaemolyticus]|nr:hypothetical protein [Vibrio parahaemolyticus]